ncbi:hypothetical protein CNO18_05645 [Gordonia sp. 1D]|nr:hypothetical protein CNO18_05645 [Gordonia sp. 1D]
MVAQSLDLPYTRYARGGFTSKAIVEQLIPKLRRQYSVGILSCGLNDAYQDLSLADLEDNLTKAVAHMVNHCERVVI